MKKALSLGACGALGTLGILAIIATSGVASAGHNAAAHSLKRTAVAKFEGGRSNLRLEAPRKVEAGSILKVKNDTNPNKIGPHTFSLVTKDSLPTTGAKQRRCEQFHLICHAIGRWHHANQQGQVGVNPVKAGKDGWNQHGNRDRRGDSFFTDKEGQTFSEKVSAHAGHTLYFICAVHPFLQAKIRVVH